MAHELLARRRGQVGPIGAPVAAVEAPVRERRRRQRDLHAVAHVRDVALDGFPQHIDGLLLGRAVGLGLVAAALGERLPVLEGLRRRHVRVDHVAAVGRERRVEQRRDGDEHEVPRRADAGVPVVERRPLRGEGLRRRRRQPRGVDADVQMEERLAAGDARRLAVEVVEERRVRRRCHECPRRPEVRVRHDDVRGDGRAVLEHDARGGAAFHGDARDGGLEAHLAAVLRDAADQRVHDALRAAAGKVEQHAVLVEVGQHVRHQRRRRLVRRRALQQEADHVEPVPQERVRDALGVQDLREGLRERRRGADQEQLRHLRQVAAQRHRGEGVLAHGRRGHAEDGLAQGLDALHQALELIRRARPAVRRQDPLAKVLAADGRGEGALGEGRAPAVVGDPRRLLADDLEDVLERVRRRRGRQARVERRAILEAEAVDFVVVRAAARVIVGLDDEHLAAEGREHRRRREAADAAADDDGVEVLRRGGAALLLGGAPRPRRERRRALLRSYERCRRCDERRYDG